MSTDEPARSISADQLAVAELVDDIDRDAQTIRFFLRERDRTLSATVEQVIAELLDAGDVEVVTGTSRVRITDEGRLRLRSGQEWEFEILQILELPSLSSKPMLRGRIRTGVLRPGDWFRTTGAVLGQIQAIEFVQRRDLDHDEAIVLKVDCGGLDVGGLLRKYEWPEPASSAQRNR